MILDRQHRRELLLIQLLTEGQFYSAAAPWSKSAGRAMERLRKALRRWLG